MRGADFCGASLQNLTEGFSDSTARFESWAKQYLYDELMNYLNQTFATPLAGSDHRSQGLPDTGPQAHAHGDTKDRDAPHGTRLVQEARDNWERLPLGYRLGADEIEGMVSESPAVPFLAVQWCLSSAYRPDLRDRRANMWLAGLQDLPPTTVVVAEDDPSRDENLLYPNSK
jgi:acetyl esterase/lipase